MALGLVLAGTPAALAGADTEPVIVVPGRLGVPIIVDGQDVRGAVIEGDWGLARGHTGLTIIRPRGPIYQGYAGRSMFRATWPRVGHFFPGTGVQPRVGGEEVIPPANRRLPPKAESLERSYKSESMPLPANNELPLYPMPPVGIGVGIDVNSGRHAGKGNTTLERTITKTNLEAAAEVVRQLRLRDIGGIVIIDFIDMNEQRNRKAVRQALEHALEKAYCVIYNLRLSLIIDHDYEP